MHQEQNYFSLDLELNNAQDNSTVNPKIIQVGIAVGNYHDYVNQSLSMYKWFLDPQEPIFEFITQLTGICNQDDLPPINHLQSVRIKLQTIGEIHEDPKTAVHH